MRFGKKYQDDSFGRGASFSKYFLKYWLFFFLFLPNQIYPQFEDYIVTTFSTDEGLSESTVAFLFQDSRGFIWISTDDGLNRFDGNQFKIFRNNSEDSSSLVGDWVHRIIEDDNKDLWIATHSEGVSRLDNKSGKFVNYRSNSNDKNSLSNDAIVFISKDKSGNIWIGTSDGLNKFIPQKNNFKRYYNKTVVHDDWSNNYFNSLIEDKPGNLWFCTRNGISLLNKDDDALINFRIENKLSSANSFSRCIESGDGTLWLNSYGAGLLKFNPISKTFSPFTKKNTKGGLPNDTVNTMYKDIDGKIWVATSSGCVTFNPSEESFAQLPKPLDEIGATHFLRDSRGEMWVATHNGLFRMDASGNIVKKYFTDLPPSLKISDNLVQSVIEDRDGNIWIGTIRGGVNCLSKNKFLFLRANSGKSNFLNQDMVFRIAEDDHGFVWIGTFDKGLNRWNRKTGEIKHFFHIPGNNKTPHARKILSPFFDRTGTLWVGAQEGGLSIYDYKTETFSCVQNLPPSLKHFTIRSFYEDRNGTFWVGTRGSGIHKYNRETKVFTQILFGSDASLLNQILSIHEDRDGDFWIGTDLGLLHYNRTTGEFYNLERDYHNPKSLSNNAIFDICEDFEGNLWLATYGGGLNRFDKKNKSFEVFKTKDGLCDNFVYNIYQVPDSTFWISTNNGLSNFNFKTRKFTNYFKEDGLPGNEFNGEAFENLKSGELMFGGTNGLILFEPTKLTSNTNPPPVFITSFKKLNKEISLPQNIFETKSIELNHDDYFFSFEFASLNFNHSEKNSYAYKMEGFDQDWNYVGSRREAFYTNLPPGNYTFKVIASNNEDVWNTNGASMKVIIPPPFYKSNWFLLLSIFAGGVFIFLIFKLYAMQIRSVEKAKADERIKAIENEKRMKEQISRDLHDEINSELTAIINNCTLLTGENGFDQSTHNRLKNIAVLSDKIRDLIRDVIWFIKPENERSDKLISKLYATASAILCNVSYDIEIDEEYLSRSKLSIEQKKHFYLIFKEALQNIAKHSHAERAKITIAPTGSALILVVNDFGNGFDLNNINEGEGFSNMKKRSRILNAQLSIESQLQKGTKVKLVLQTKHGIEIDSNGDIECRNWDRRKEWTIDN